MDPWVVNTHETVLQKPDSFGLGGGFKKWLYKVGPYYRYKWSYNSIYPCRGYNPNENGGNHTKSSGDSAAVTFLTPTLVNPWVRVT